MTPVERLIDGIEAAGGVLAIHGERIRCRLPEDATYLLEELRKRRSDVLAALRRRNTIPLMPPGVRLIGWHLKEPPIAIESCAIVIDPAAFARSTLEQLWNALENPKRWIGWTIPQLVDRLAQIGVEVEVSRETGFCEGGSKSY
jgi:hypothetical protein